MCSRTPKKKVPQSIRSSYTGFAAKSVRIDALGFAAVRKSTYVLETGGERIRNVFEMEGALPERKRQLSSSGASVPQSLRMAAASAS